MNLRNYITKELLHHLATIEFPHDPTIPLDAAQVGHDMFGADHTAAYTTTAIKHTLTALSTLSRTTEHDWLCYLPPKTSPTFPEQALGLVILLDQAPRYCCTGVNIRYAHAHSNIFARQVVSQSLSLPDDENPFVAAAWRKTGYEAGNVFVRRAMLFAPIVHCDGPSDVPLLLNMTEILRKQIETWSNTCDPHRHTAESDEKDLYAMFDLLQKGPPTEPGHGIEAFMYWMLRYYRLHIGYLKHFGRNPLRNDAIGRVGTEEEEEWLWRVNGERTEEQRVVRDLIREDVKLGVWRPLELD